MESPCATCFPGVHDYYAAAYRIYSDCSDQLLLGFGGAVSINIVAINLILDCYSVELEERLDFYRDVRHIFNLVSKEERAIAKAKAPKNK